MELWIQEADIGKEVYFLDNTRNHNYLNELN